eukprot:1994922-Pyramimonas_sp.AAC.1
MSLRRTSRCSLSLPSLTDLIYRTALSYCLDGGGEHSRSLPSDVKLVPQFKARLGMPILII